MKDMLMFRPKAVFIFIIVLCTCASACATATPQQKALWQLDASRPVTCMQGADCEAKWGQALLWVQRNSIWKLRIANDMIITTEGPFDTPSSAFSITKVPAGSGVYSIEFGAGCGNIFGCVPSILELQASFVRSVMGPIKVPPATMQKDANTEKLRFGASFLKMNQTSATLFGLKEPRGVVVISVVQDSVAFKAGARQGDAIFKYGDKIINDPLDLQSAVAETTSGSIITITIWRASQGEITIHAQF